MALNAQNIGLALQGLGAGFSGRGAEFQRTQQLQQAQQATLSKERKQAALQDTQVALDAIDTGNPDRAIELLTNRVADINTLGGDPTDTQGVLVGLQTGSGPQYDAAIDDLRRTEQEGIVRGLLKKRPDKPGTTVLKATEISPTGQVITRGPQGKLTATDIEGFKVAKSGNGLIKSSEITEGFIVRENSDGSFTKTKVLDVAPTTGEGGKASAVTKIFGNGTTIQALPNGQVQVRGPDGNILQGEDRLTALKLSREEEGVFQRTISGEKKAGSAAIDKSAKAFESLGKIKTSIANMTDAIKVLDEGAGTGPILSRLPSFQAASVKLDNIQKAMGLDVIGTTTFGALSKGELDLALTKALPTRLKPIALREWLVDKQAAQEKLVGYLESVAIYLGTPGNTIPGWIEAQQEIKAGEQRAQADGQQQPEAGITPAAQEDVATGQTTAEGFQIFTRPDGSTYAVSP